MLQSSSCGSRASLLQTTRCNGHSSSGSTRNFLERHVSLPEPTVTQNLRICQSSFSSLLKSSCMKPRKSYFEKHRKIGQKAIMSSNSKEKEARCQNFSINGHKHVLIRCPKSERSREREREKQIWMKNEVFQCVLLFTPSYIYTRLCCF